MLVNRFKPGLPPKLRQLAALVTMNFDTVVILVSRVVSDQQKASRESVQEVRK